MTRSRATLLELTLFVSDLDRSMAFFSSPGLSDQESAWGSTHEARDREVSGFAVDLVISGARSQGCS